MRYLNLIFPHLLKGRQLVTSETDTENKYTEEEDISDNCTYSFATQPLKIVRDESTPYERQFQSLHFIDSITKGQNYHICIK